MNIILFADGRGQARNIDINPLAIGAILLVLLAVVCAASAYTGFRLGDNGHDYVAEWKADIRRQQAALETARETAQSNLDALAMRVGQLQAQMLRLNALGERLVSKADLDEQEFDFDAIPATGGPQQKTADLSPTGLDHFIAILDRMDAGLTDREHKLGVVETLLMDRSLSERVIPSGRPIRKGWLSSKFGKRADPFTGKQEHHKGVDFAGREGADVLAVGDGVVTWSGKRSGYGNLVEINHGNGYVTRYGHNKANTVEAGETVKKGQQIAMIGSTGRSTGPHVHFEVLRNGSQVNPAKFINN
ncbi:MAG: M23 family metallopeptidase [Thiohalobacterales bacterium]|nr:M23 family metallopeptidase [Thiohalobacterales bacterium]